MSRFQGRTIKTTDYRFLRRTLLHHELNVRVLSGKVFDMVVDVPSEVGGGWPGVAILEDELSNLGNKSSMPVRGFRLESSPVHDWRSCSEHIETRHLITLCSSPPFVAQNLSAERSLKIHPDMDTDVHGLAQVVFKPVGLRCALHPFIPRYLSP